MAGPLASGPGLGHAELDLVQEEPGPEDIVLRSFLKADIALLQVTVS